MVLAYKDLGDHVIFDKDKKKYDLKNEYRMTKKSTFGTIQGDSVFSVDGENHKIKITKEDVASCKVEFSTDGRMKIKSDKLISNMELEAVLKKKGTASFSGDYITESWRSKISVDATLNGDLSLSSEAVLACEGLSVGVCAKVDNTPSLVDYNTAINWEVDENTTYTAHTEDTCDKLNFTCVKKVGADAELAGRLTFICNNTIGLTTDLHFGAKFPLYGGTSQWLLGSKAMNLFYSKKLSDNVEAGLSVNYPVSRGFGGISHGFRLAFS